MMSDPELGPSRHAVLHPAMGCRSAISLGAQRRCHDDSQDWSDCHSRFGSRSGGGLLWRDARTDETVQIRHAGVLRLRRNQAHARGLDEGVKPVDGVCHYFKVDAIDATVAELKNKGLRFEDEPHLVARMPDHELWMTFFKDPDGHLLALMEERR